jgi:hypothetical protein
MGRRRAVRKRHITRIEDCIDYAAAAAAPYSTVQILGRAKRVVVETGLYHKDLEKWDENLFLAKDWSTFKAYILAAQRKQRKRSATSKQSGYGLAIQKMTELANGVAGVANAVSATDAKTEARIIALTAELSLMRKQHSEMMVRFNAPAVACFNAPAVAPRQQSQHQSQHQSSHQQQQHANHANVTSGYQKMKEATATLTVTGSANPTTAPTASGPKKDIKP